MNVPTAQQPLLFGGRRSRKPVWKTYEEFITTPEAFLHWIATIWVNEHEAPTEPPALTAFEIEELKPQFDAFLKSGKRLPERALSVEELWLLNQLALRTPINCLMNAAQPKQPDQRISHKQRLPAAKIRAELQAWYANPGLRRPRPDQPAGIGPMSVLVYDGADIAHVITALTLADDTLHYADSWPGTSLLCKPENAAGVAARKSDLVEGAWRISAAEFEKVVFAVLLYNFPPVIAHRH